MPYTVLEGLTDEELMLDVYNDERSEPREVELAKRLGYARDTVEDLTNELALARELLGVEQPREVT